MKLLPYVVGLTAMSGCCAQSIVTRVLAGKPYCHETTLTTTWTVDTGGDRHILRAFRDGRGELEYRRVGPDSVLVSFYTEKYQELSPVRVYSSKKFLVPLKSQSLVRPATDAQWNAG